MDASKFLVEHESDVAVIRFNDPGSMNALTMPMAQEMYALLEQAEQTSAAIILCGDKRSFCAGANLDAGAGGAQPGEIDAGLGLEEQINPLVLKLRNLKVPLITAIRGAAAGVGASLAMMGDIIVAGRNAYFLQAFCRIGLVPDGGSPWLLARTVGRVRAMELMMLGEKIKAVDAFAWGMVTRLVDCEDVDKVAMELAQKLAKGPVMSLGLLRQAAWSAADSTFEDELALERRLQTKAGYHPDFKEGVAAFLEKRPARFGGAAALLAPDAAPADA